MNTLKNIFAGPQSRRPHRIIGAVALLVAWSFFGTTRQVMHLGAFLEMLLWLGGTDMALCLWLYARHQVARISSVVKTENSPAADKDEMEKAA